MPPRVQRAPNMELRNEGIVKTGIGTEPKKILIFFDGTGNKWKSRTNVRRLFEMVGSRQDPNVICYYMDGVGARGGVLGLALGLRMKTRIVEGYRFLSENYNPNDEIYIFGFSRGALQARALAGIISYCGLLDSREIGKQSLAKASERVWSLCLESNDVSEATVWREYREKNIPLVDNVLRTQIHCTNRYADVKFVGVWDTVPGSWFKSFTNNYTESEDRKPGIRYKLSAYPPIHEIVHAVSLDELRSKFRAVLVGAPIDPSRTTIRQEWFPGVHSDIGGGYEDDSDLAGLTLNWMLEALEPYQLFGENGHIRVYENVRGVAHESLDDFPNNLCSYSLPRWQPGDIKLNGSVQGRVDAGEVLRRAKSGWFGHKYITAPYVPTESGPAIPPH